MKANSAFSRLTNYASFDLHTYKPIHVCVSILQNMTISRLCSDRKKVITLTDNLLARADDYYYHHQ